MIIILKYIKTSVFILILITSAINAVGATEIELIQTLFVRGDIRQLVLIPDESLIIAYDKKNVCVNTKGESRKVPEKYIVQKFKWDGAKYIQAFSENCQKIEKTEIIILPDKPVYLISQYWDLDPLLSDYWDTYNSILLERKIWDLGEYSKLPWKVKKIQSIGDNRTLLLFEKTGINLRICERFYGFMVFETNEKGEQKKIFEYFVDQIGDANLIDILFGDINGNGKNDIVLAGSEFCATCNNIRLDIFEVN